MAKKGPPNVVQGWTLPAHILRKHKKVSFLAICAFALLLRIILSLHSYSGVSSIPDWVKGLGFWLCTFQVP